MIGLDGDDLIFSISSFSFNLLTFVLSFVLFEPFWFNDGDGGGSVVGSGGLITFISLFDMNGGNGGCINDEEGDEDAGDPYDLYGEDVNGLNNVICGCNGETYGDAVVLADAAAAADANEG